VLNLANLTAVSQVIVRAAQARENSRGAHFRSDFEAPGDLATSTYTQARAAPDGAIDVTQRPVRFTRVRPGESLVAPG
jgi:fumarate reductase flavoprotein subunit